MNKKQAEKRGNRINQLMAHSKPLAPLVGMGVTICLYTDRHAGTILKVADNGKRFWFKQDKAIRTDKNSMSESQEYRFEPNPDSELQEARLGKDGRWYTTGGKRNGTSIVVGHRSEYYDYSF